MKAKKHKDGWKNILLFENTKNSGIQFVLHYFQKQTKNMFFHTFEAQAKNKHN